MESAQNSREIAKTPLITIGIASYNYAEYITKILDAIKGQEFKRYEVLISDDCSSDDSVAIIKTYMAENPQMPIRLLESAVNEGLIANKNKIIAESIGEYLMICDSDDWMADHCLQRMAEEIEKNHPDRIISEVANIKPNGEIIQVQRLLPTQSKWCWTIHHGGGYRKKVIIDHGIRIKEGMPDDLYFITEFNKYCDKISILPEILYYWNVHPDSEGRKKISDLHSLELFTEKTLKYIYNTILYIQERRNNNYKRDTEELRFLALKIYFFNIFFPLQRNSLKEKLIYYKLMHSVMKNLDGKYWHNVLLHCSSDCAPVRKSTFGVIKLCVFLEKMNLMSISLGIFHLITRFTYIDQ